MRAREGLARVLSGTGLYQLTGSTPVDWELDAYGVGFALVEERFDALLADLFTATAGRQRLARWEALFRPQGAAAPVEDCRESVTRRLAVRPDSFTPAEAQAMLPGAGVRGLLLENGEGGLTLVLGRLLGVTKEEAQRELSALLPAHLPCAWEEDVTWVALDAYARPFGEWDEKALSWARLDAVTRQDLENDFEEDA